MDDQESGVSSVERLLGVAASCDPDTDRFGLLMTVRAGKQDERHMVLWFDRSTTFTTFLELVFPPMFCNDDDVQDLLENLEAIKPLIHAEGLPESVMEELNEYTRRWARFDWLGTFDDLCAADTEHTRLVVASFRADVGEENDEPVAADDRDDFAEYLNGVNDT